ncbi:glucosamine-6-phosphate deaminase [Kurthia zopfii]|uniref:glucosamine-6-phosphate deaminase n=1 Tax=Kurthia zopfii TaxID=1650 RepID=UPI000F6F1F04|nr:glucosamine-6-phosphate deaminase [Kurthia zopfii]VEI07866.1 Glucosamine-6-phosphate deaminase [Kurthia zopfii]
MSIKLEIIKNEDELYTRALEIFQNELAKGSNTFGLATGGTMVPLYEKMAASDIDFSKCNSFNLDEYVGLPASHPESYVSFMTTNLFSKKPFAHSELPNGEAADPVAEAAQYEEKLRNAQLDFQLLGIGENGHIGFNEPGTPFDAPTHVVELTQSTREANARFFNSIDEVPTKAITMGISSIARAKTVLLIAVGEKKRDALNALINGEATIEVPVTALKDHQDFIVLTDLDL